MEGKDVYWAVRQSVSLSISGVLTTANPQMASTKAGAGAVHPGGVGVGSGCALLLLMASLIKWALY